MDTYSALFAGLGLTFGMMFLFIFLIYFVLLFFLGLVLYFFTGSKPGESLIKTMARLGTRFYAHMWMFINTFLALTGLALLLKVIMGSLFPGFVYVKQASTFGSAAVDYKQSDFQLGLVLIVLSILVFAIHMGVAFVVESAEEKKGTLMTKMFNTTGLVVSGFILFGGMFTFIMELITYSKQGVSTYGVKPGATLAFVLASLPIWGYYLSRAVWMVKKEG